VNRIWTIAKKESKTALKDNVFVLIVILFLVLSILSVYIGSSTKGALIKVYTNIVAVLKTQGATEFPPAPQIFPLAILQNLITYVSIVGAVLSIFLGFDTFSGEKENGTMKLILTRPLYRDQLVSGKLLGGALVIALLLSVTLIINLVLFTFVSGIPRGQAGISRLSAFIVLAFLYMMSFYVAAVFTSIKTNDRAFGFMIMLIVWVGTSFVIPQLAESQKSFAYAINAAAQTMTQIPSETVVSKVIDIFSPSVNFNLVSKDLLQVNADTAQSAVIVILGKHVGELLYMLAPGVIMLLASYKSFLKEAV
jgi:ABC-2 type transport system permease protein